MRRKEDTPQRRQTHGIVERFKCEASSAKFKEDGEEAVRSEVVEWRMCVR